MGRTRKRYGRQPTVDTLGGPALPHVLAQRIAKAQAEDDGEPLAIGPSHSETPEQARERLEARAASRNRRWSERLPGLYAGASLEHFPEPVADRLRRAMGDRRVLNIVLAGPVGTGKTHAAYALGRVGVAQGLWVEAWTVHDLMLEMLPSAADPYRTELRAKRCDVLVLDDFGANRATEFSVDTLTSILNARVAGGLKTIVTTNVQEAALAEAWDWRLVDRLRQGLVAETFAGPSRRAPAW